VWALAAVVGAVPELLKSVLGTRWSKPVLMAQPTLVVILRPGSLGRRASQGALHGSAKGHRQRLALVHGGRAPLPSRDPCLAAAAEVVAAARRPC
jgi:hypothetical protein